MVGEGVAEFRIGLGIGAFGIVTRRSNDVTDGDGIFGMKIFVNA